jgi:hypothetical protein
MGRWRFWFWHTVLRLDALPRYGRMYEPWPAPRRMRSMVMQQVWYWRRSGLWGFMWLIRRPHRLEEYQQGYQRFRGSDQADSL